MSSIRCALPALLLGATLSCNALAQGYPEKAVRVIVPFPPGGAADIVARHFTTRLAAVIGQQIIVDNRGGAGGIIGGEIAARLPADGYGLLFASSSVLSINPHLGAKAPYDVLKNFTPIVKIGDAPNVLTVHPSVPAKTVRELIVIAKARPEALAYASNGTGTLSHLTGELFSQQAGVKMLHVPYKGAAPATIDTVAGTSVRNEGEPPSFRLVSTDSLAAEVAAEVRLVRHRHHNTGIVAPERLIGAIGDALAAIGLRATAEVQHLAHDQVPIFGAEAVKGLEFDGVVVVNPHEILGDQPDQIARGARLLYVALTRAVQTVHLVADAPLPAVLADHGR